MKINLPKFLYALIVGFILVLIAGKHAVAEPTGQHKFLIGKRENMERTISSDPVVAIETNKGTIKVDVFQKEAPITANNFLDLVQRGFYNGVKFHRYEPGFVIQGGDPKGDGTGGFVDPQSHRERTIPLEIKANLRHNSAGMVAMARSQSPDSASSQFYITLAPASFLDDQYAVFGKVVDGLNVVQQLRAGDKMNNVAVLESAPR